MPLNVYTPSPSTVFFVDPVYVKQTTPLSANVDDKSIMAAIQTAQDLLIMPILGSTLYKTMEFEISGGTLQSIHTYLITAFIQPILANACMVELLPLIAFQFKDKGVMKAKSDFTEQVDQKTVEWLMEKFKGKCYFYAQRLTQYLIDNTSIYPNYLNPQLGTTSSGADLYYPNSTSYNGGIYLPNQGLGSPYTQYRGYGMTGDEWINANREDR